MHGGPTPLALSAHQAGRPLTASRIQPLDGGTDGAEHGPRRSRSGVCLALGTGEIMNISWGKALSVWWSIAWRGVIYGALGGFVLGFIGGVMAALMHSPERAPLYGMIGGYIASIPASMLAVKQAISKHLPALAALVKAVQH